NAPVMTFAVVTADVFNDGTLRVVVDFDKPVSAGSVQPGDLLVDGSQPATSVSLVDADTVQFVLPAQAAGTHSLAIAGGTISDSTGATVDPFSRTFVIAAAQYTINQ